MQIMKVLVILLRGKWNNCVFDFAIINISASSTVMFDIDHYLMHLFSLFVDVQINMQDHSQEWIMMFSYRIENRNPYL